MCSLGLLFGHNLSHLKFEIHVVMHLSQRRLKTRSQKYKLVKSNALALKRDGRWNSHWFTLVHVTPQTHLQVSAQPI